MEDEFDTTSVLEPARQVPEPVEAGPIEQYLPWLRHADETVRLLHTLGLTRRQVTEALIGRPVAITGEIRNPADGRLFLVASTTLTATVRDGGASLAVLLDGKPVAAWFADRSAREAVLRMAASQEEVVMDLYEENLELRRLLAGKVRTYK